MSRKSRNASNRPRARSTRTDFKLYSRYETREAAEADLNRLMQKAERMIYVTESPLIASMYRQEPATAIQPAGEDTADAEPGTDYQSIIISKERAKGTAEWYYSQDSDGELSPASAAGLLKADDPEGMPAIPRPDDTVYEGGAIGEEPNLPEPSPTRHDYVPLKGDDGKRDKARRFINPATGEIISRRAHMKLSGIIPEVKKADRRPPVKHHDPHVVIISYGVTTND